MKRPSKFLTAILAATVLTLISPTPSRAHCDGMDGPVVKAAQQAFAKGDVNLALVWVQPADEAEIRRAFDETMSVRKMGAAAKDLADRYFFETLVRVHRAGEGAPYTGLKPAGRDLGPAIPAADKALSTGDVSPLLTLLLDEVREGVANRHKAALRAMSYKPSDLAAGRDYVREYVTYVHYVEGLYLAATRATHGHFDETEDEAEATPPAAHAH